MNQVQCFCCILAWNGMSNTFLRSSHPTHVVMVIPKAQLPPFSCLELATRICSCHFHWTIQFREEPENGNYWFWRSMSCPANILQSTYIWSGRLNAEVWIGWSAQWETRNICGGVSVFLHTKLTDCSFSSCVTWVNNRGCFLQSRAGSFSSKKGKERKLWCNNIRERAWLTDTLYCMHLAWWTQCKS